MKIFTTTTPPTPTSFVLNSDRAAAAGWLGGIFRRLLCGGLPVRPSGGAEEARGGEAEERKMGGASPAPGIVARLMGLDSLPELPSTTTTTPNSVVRSRSMGSLDSGRPCPRMETSSSFREVPTFLRKESEDFLLLSFEPGGGGEEEVVLATELDRIKVETCFRILEERDEEKRKSKSKRGGEVSEEMVVKKHMVKEREKKKKKSSDLEKRGGDQSESSSSQNSSPVSVLNFPMDLESDYFIELETPSVAKIATKETFYVKMEEDPNPLRRNSRAKLSLDLDTHCNPSPGLHIISKSEGGGRGKRFKEGTVGTRDRGRPPLRFSELWSDDDGKEWNWVWREWSKTEEFQELAVASEVEIFEFLLQEAVEECCR